MVLSGCARPAAPVALSDIDSRELTLLQLARESTAYFQRSRFVDARLGFETVLFFEPNLRNVKENLSLTLSELGLYAEAHAIIQELLAEYPESFRLRLALGANALRAGKIDDAFRYYNDALTFASKRKSPGQMAEALRSLLFTAVAVGDFEAAECYAYEASQLSPNPQITIARAKAMLAGEKPAEAIRILTEVDGNVADVRVYLAIALFGNAQFEEAQQAVRRLSLEARSLSPAATSDFQLLSVLFENFDFALDQDGKLALSITDPDAMDVEKVADTAQLALSSESVFFYPALLLDAFLEIQRTNE
jgi:tetratricopeptide (TPR) repeat protein